VSHEQVSRSRISRCYRLSESSVTSAWAQFPTEDIPTTEPEYIAKVKIAAPALVANNATITMPQDALRLEL